ncbi:hypothetical protein FGB62_24g023 [Gracilaria domingensis]|nr:hypothetical protein FGB62_24g023 [Gracilaria domingensis]
MPHCDVCLGEVRDVGVLRCNHSVCRSCGVSQSSCLVCNGVGRSKRRRLVTSRLNQRPRRNDTANAKPVTDRAKLRSRNPSQPAQKTLSAALSTAQSSGVCSALATALEPLHPPAPGRSISPESDQAEPPTKYRKIAADHDISKAATRASSSEARASSSETQTPSSEMPSRMRFLKGPTAFDEVRCELLPLGSAPKLERPALRTTRKVDVSYISRYLRERLELHSTEIVVIKCAGQELVGTMTLGDLVTHVWPASEGHLVLHYEVPNVHGTE